MKHALAWAALLLPWGPWPVGHGSKDRGATAADLAAPSAPWGRAGLAGSYELTLLDGRPMLAGATVGAEVVHLSRCPEVLRVAAWADYGDGREWIEADDAVLTATARGWHFASATGVEGILVHGPFGLESRVLNGPNQGLCRLWTPID